MQQLIAQTSLTKREADLVEVLAHAAADVDGVAPLSEQYLLGVRSAGDADRDDLTHVLAWSTEAEGAEPAETLIGYGQLQTSGPAASAEIVVHPQWRRRGVGTRILDALPDPIRLWAHGPVPGALEFTTANGLVPVRELLRMERDLATPLPPTGVPPAYRVRPFRPGADDAAWLSANRDTFAHHLEQGSLTERDLADRMAQDWFDAHGFLLIVPVDEPGRIAAFHWTKIEPPTSRISEVYAVGVRPAYQGQGLGRAATLVGLHHLADRGMTRVSLYVDGDNEPAVRTYAGLGFTVTGRDVQLSRNHGNSGTI